MTVLAGDRNTPRKMSVPSLIVAPVAAAARLFLGALVNVNAAGYGVAATDTAGESCLGTAHARADNQLGAAGAMNVTVDRYPHEAAASGMTAADLFADAFVVDDQTVGRGIAAQPVNVTGVALKRLPGSRGGTRALAFTATGTLLAYGGGTAVNVAAGGEFVLTAADGAQIHATVTAGGLAVGNQSDNIQLRHVRAGKIVEVVSATSVFVDPNL